MNLPEINNPELIEEYEIAFTNYLKIDSPEQFNVGLIIKFLTENEPFAKYGFFRGFSNLIYTAVMSDSRSTSDIWLLSVFQKLLSFEIQDKEFLYLIERNIEKNFERYCNTAL